MVMELETAKAPVTVANFLQYVNAGFYNGTAFHRIISTFMVQGGGYTYTNGSYVLKTTNAAIELEKTTTTGLSNTVGTVAMARSTLPNSATSQFFVNVVDNSSNLNGTATTSGYAVFGKVISGLDTLDALKAVPVQNNGLGEVSMPVTPVQLQWVYQLK
jgi:cyclophilin family peptidyl-prolyl cis-trans isomerase